MSPLVRHISVQQRLVCLPAIKPSVHETCGSGRAAEPTRVCTRPGVLSTAPAMTDTSHARSLYSLSDLCETAQAALMRTWLIF